MFGIGPPEMIIVGIIAVLLFGKRLPEVGRTFGKGIMEFKKGMREMQSEFHAASSEFDSATATTKPAVTHRADLDDSEPSTAPKFEPPAREPQAT